MSRAFYDEKKYKKNIMKIFEAHNEGDKFSNIFTERQNNQVFYTAARMVRLFAKPYSSFKRLLELSAQESKAAISLDDMLKSCPIIIPTPNNPNSVRVFYNIPLDIIDDEPLASCSWVFYFNVLDTFWDTYKRDMEGVKRQGWEPFSRAWARIRKYEDMPTARALARFTNLSKNKLVDDARLRDIAAGIDEQRKPMELLFADKPEDFVDMYKTGPSSCMSYAKDGYKTWGPVLDSYNVHPASFFAYHPYIRGVYAKYKGQVCARTMLYQKEDGRWHYGRLYSSIPKLLEKFEQTLKELGHTWLGTHERSENKFRRKCTFEVPGFQYGSDFALPLPYCDNLGAGITVAWDAVKKVFIVDCSENDLKTNIHHQAQTGVIYTRNLSSRPCAYCGKLERADRKHVEAQDGTAYCGSVCATSNGYVYALRSDGLQVWVLKGGTIFDKHQEVYFTTIEACRARGGLPIIDNLDDDPEDEEEFTLVGQTIDIGGILYKFPALSSSGLTAYSKAGRLVNSGKFHSDGSYIYALQGIYDATDKPNIDIKEQRVVFYEDGESLVA